MWQLYQDPATDCSGDHRMEQRGTLSIINSLLVVLSTRPMHILKKYPVNMLCIGLVRRLDKKNQHPRHWRELISQHLHTAPSKSAQLLGDQKTNFGHHTEYAAQRLPRCLKKKKQKKNYIARQEIVQREPQAICHIRIQARMIPQCYFLLNKVPCRWCILEQNLHNVLLVYN